MADNQQESTSGTAAQRMFGPQAGVYAVSTVHVRDDSLDSVQRLAAEAAPYRWTVDLGTGAGFTAFAMAQVSEHVVASDITRPMLQQAERIGGERGLGNLGICQNAAESLPFSDASLDLVTSRVAAHHFRDFEAALNEAQRVLKTGGSLVMADSISPEDDAVSDWMNDIELRRDFSHVENRKVSVIQQLLAERGLEIAGHETTRVYLMFNEWVARTKVQEDEVAALQNDFMSATPEVKDAFQVEPLNEDGDFQFSWPCWIFRAVKS